MSGSDRHIDIDALTRAGLLLQLADPTLPIGGFNHSGGLETFVQQGVVHDVATLKTFVYTQLQQNWLHNDGAYVSLAFNASTEQNLDELLWLDKQIGAAKVARELRESSYKLGVRLLKIFAAHTKVAIVASYQAALAAQQVRGFYPLVFGLLAAAMQLDKAATLQAFYYNAAVGLITNGVKLIPLSQMAGQEMLIELHTVIAQTVQASMQPHWQQLGATTLATDIRAMQHERLYTRLYMS
ncbi:urease accessory protein UreF [Snodgrassella communis]|uniref:Urease accessory protein UreF n=1 Tax=Snodgrassella communis TaxID=2946699 RepID=A0A066TP63_9NEIS|nr:urease accessory protein UreF [Snodgrassella communis]KDN11448.1 Urease accessory protein UreF [Snodgrassella communis]KDN13858.1 Urease accessory protein UreF [Snodgrassella communis]PIT11219.1 urease accessory protein UreF [Snodgrassella communis]PIT27032.1 urease accessory protein UreF [Snodgrassella communis]PIT30069.1 urease accessory protein UreF [Snodgrassella communis]